MITSQRVKEMAHKFEADLCGIAPADRFTDAPASTHPCEILPTCRSVIVVARRFPSGTLQGRSTIPYTVVRNQLSAVMDRMTLDLTWELEQLGAVGLPVGAIGPTNRDPVTGRARGLISLKHAAELAGLGRIGKNTLLVNDRYGNMIWLGAVITDAALDPDPLVEYQTCPPECETCIQICPVRALGSPLMDQAACWNYAFGPEGAGGWRIKCHRCRSECPNHLGI